MINHKRNIFYILALSLSVSGCELLGPELHKKLPLEPVAEEDLAKQTEEVFPELSNDGADEANADDMKIEIFPGTGQSINQIPRAKKSKPSGKGEYSLNFDEADLGEVAKVILSDILGENYILGPKVAGKVTLQTSKPLSRSELLPTLDMLLDINNAAMVYQDGVYQIKNKASAVQSSAFSTYSKYRKQVPAGYQVKVIPVKNVAVEEIAEIIKPLMQQKSILHVDGSRNIMLIAGTEAELDRAMDMVNTFDVDMMKGRSFALFPLQNVDAVKISEELEQIFNKKSSNSEFGFFKFIAIERLNAVLAITHQAKYLKDMERWIIKLDRANTAGGGGVNVYRVQHVDALELSNTLNEIFSEGGKKDKAASVAAGRKTVEVTNKKKKQTKTAKTRNKTGVATLSDIGDVNIIADEVNNALIIVASAQDYTVVQQVIKQLDVMPLQVLIDATIIEVTLKDELKYGIKWFLSHNNGGSNFANMGGNFAGTEDSEGENDGNFTPLFENIAKHAVGASTGGIGYAFMSDSKDIGAVLDAAATDNIANVISSPSIMVLNNQEATIQVGKEVPILKESLTNSNSDSGNITNSIEMRETGITLKVTPRVNANGLVIMEIDQKADDVINTTAEGIQSPSFQQRQLKTKVAIQNGETIVLGGLISEIDSFNKGGIPLLHKLPLIGSLFGQTDKKNNKTELVVLITPRVVKTRQDARLITNEFQRKLSGIYEENMDRVYKPVQTSGHLQRKHRNIPRIQ
jgi:general secretion pathway protein D